MGQTAAGPGQDSLPSNEGPCVCLSLMPSRSKGNSHCVPLLQERTLKLRDWPEQDGRLASGPLTTHCGAALCPAGWKAYLCPGLGC